MDVRALVAETETELRARATPARAAKEKAYLKSSLEHYGTSVPAIRSVAKEVARRDPALGHDELIAVGARSMGGRRRLLDPAVGIARAARAAAWRNRRLRPFLAVRGRDARGEGVLRAQSDRLGAARNREEATGARLPLAVAQSGTGFRRDGTRGGETAVGATTQRRPRRAREARALTACWSASRVHTEGVRAPSWRSTTGEDGCPTSSRR